MDINITKNISVSEINSKVILLGVFKDTINDDKLVREFDKVLDGIIKSLIEEGELSGKEGEIIQIFTNNKINSNKLVIAGLGEYSSSGTNIIRKEIADALKYIKNNTVKPEQVACVLDERLIGDRNYVQALVEAAILSNYTFKKHITSEKSDKEIKEFLIYTPNSENSEEINKGIEKGEIYAEAACFTRDMVNESANYMTPSVMAETAVKIASDSNLEVTVLERDEIEKLNMGGIIGVSQGSRQPPKLIVISYKSKETEEIDMAVIGKGVTFDSGGISIKPSENMGEMKTDMSGGAAAMGVMLAISKLKPLVNITAIIPAVENLPDGNAIRPGDILTMMNGKTVEIISTDAEGRLILADAICYAKKLGIKKIIDIATLTGACKIALGDICTGVFGNDQDLINNILKSGEKSDECMWQLPCMDEYKDLNRSDVADIKNTGGRYAGAITAAWFLREFAENVDWVHLDIAGTAYIDKERGCYRKGATGIPVRTLINAILNL
jgi:leucyl aminopeptidase